MSDFPMITNGPYGFAWGPLEVVRATEHNGYCALDVKTEAGKRLTVYVSPTGRSIRVFGDGGEWKAAAVGVGEQPQPEPYCNRCGFPHSSDAVCGRNPK